MCKYIGVKWYVLPVLCIFGWAQHQYIDTLKAMAKMNSESGRISGEVLFQQPYRSNAPILIKGHFTVWVTRVGYSRIGTEVVVRRQWYADGVTQVVVLRWHHQGRIIQIGAHQKLLGGHSGVRQSDRGMCSSMATHRPTDRKHFRTSWAGTLGMLQQARVG
uniref:Uncharacterized protein n=1 Tax=Ditylenchus dipsaci TaxID=166011 RepID=A0A915DI31_9BILA